MPNKNLIRVSEFEKLYYDPENKKPFREKHWHALCRYLETANKKEKKRVEYFRILNKGIQFTNFVGVIQAGNLTIEVLPKVDKGNTTAANQTVADLEDKVAAEKQKWQSVLLQMLKECRLLKVNHVDYASLNLKSNSILDIYIELFIAEVQKLQHEGLLKKYRKKEGNQTALKGQLLFQKQIAYNSTHQERFYVRYTEYNQNNIYNQLLYQVLCIIPRLSNSTHLADKVARVLLDFPEVSKITVNEETFKRLQFDRKTERYHEALLIAKMLLLNYRPDITGGSDNVIAILFDMNKLWEEFVYRRLKREEGNNRIVSVQGQQRKDFWWHEQGDRSTGIKPDIVVVHKNEHGEALTTIIDTKWKIVDDLLPGDADLKQMFVYNLYWECNRSMLLYPANTQQVNKGGYHHFDIPDKMHSQCMVQTISIFDNNEQLNASFGKTLSELIMQ